MAVCYSTVKFLQHNYVLNYKIFEIKESFMHVNMHVNLIDLSPKLNI